MKRCYIVDTAKLAEVDKQVSVFLNTSPVPIMTGEHAGKHAVNTDIFASSPRYESLRAALEICPVADLDEADLTTPEDL